MSPYSLSKSPIDHDAKLKRKIQRNTDTLITMIVDFDQTKIQMMLHEANNKINT